MRSLIIQQAFQYTIIQQYFAFTGSYFVDMLRLSYQRHAAYALAHNFDYWHILGQVVPQAEHGGWCKVALIGQALEQGYDFIAWIDADAAVTADCDLREALPEGKQIGAVFHDAPWFKEPQWSIEPHYNVGVSYWRKGPESLAFAREWLQSYPGHTRWLEQGSFNELIKKPEYAAVFHKCDDTWNATVNVHKVDKPHVTGWHGIMPMAKRLAMMKSAMGDDFLKFRV